MFSSLLSILHNQRKDVEVGDTFPASVLCGKMAFQQIKIYELIMTISSATVTCTELPDGRKLMNTNRVIVEKDMALERKIPSQGHGYKI